jgi:diguanylate cyclase (GGDEF)-like protein
VRAAAAAQILARRAGGVSPGDAFLAALLQDIGVLVLLRLAPTVYLDVPVPFRHDDLASREIEHLGMDHAEVAGVLLESWNLPVRIVDAVSRSHVGGSVLDRLTNIVTLGGIVADWVDGASELLPPIVGLAEELLGLDVAELTEALDELATALPDLSQLFEATPPPADSLTDMAADVLVARELRRRVQPGSVYDDLTDLTEAARQLVAASRFDALTGLVNRGHLDVVLEREFQQAKQTGTGLAILFIDLDDFRSVNECHGHSGGDTVIRKAAERIARCVRECDVAARYGGDEFVVVMPRATGDVATAAADRLMRAFGAPIDVAEGVPHAQTITIGVASLDEAPETASVAALLDVADAALFEAKRSGKDQFLVATSPT